MVTVYLENVKRVGTTEGNPTWRLICTGFEFVTEPGAQVGHEATNWVGRMVDLSLNDRGRVIGMEAA